MCEMNTLNKVGPPNSYYGKQSSLTKELQKSWDIYIKVQRNVSLLMPACLMPTYFTINVPGCLERIKVKCIMLVRSIGLFINLSLVQDLSRYWNKWVNGLHLLQECAFRLHWIYSHGQLYTQADMGRKFQVSSKKGSATVIKHVVILLTFSHREVRSLSPLHESEWANDQPLHLGEYGKVMLYDFCSSHKIAFIFSDVARKLTFAVLRQLIRSLTILKCLCYKKAQAIWRIHIVGV